MKKYTHKHKEPEKLCREIVEFYFKGKKEILFNHRPDWLKNIETGKNLELDVFIPELQFAVEVDGPHHKLKEQIKKDNFKDEECAKKGICLIHIRRIDNDFFRLINILNKRSKLGHIPNWIRKDVRDCYCYYRFLYSTNKGKKIRKRNKYFNITDKKLERQDKEQKQIDETEGVRRRRLLKVK